MSFPTKLTKETLKLEEGEAFVLGTSKKKKRTEKKLKTLSDSNKRVAKQSVLKEASFSTIIRKNSELICAEMPDRPINEVLREKSEDNVMLVKAKRKNYEGMRKKNICEKISTL